MHESEVLNLILGFVCLGVIVATIGVPKDHTVRHFWSALLALLASYMCTNLEHVFLPTLFNFIEHLLFAIAALFFVAASLSGRESETVYDD